MKKILVPTLMLFFATLGLTTFTPDVYAKELIMNQPATINGCSPTSEENLDSYTSPFHL